MAILYRGTQLCRVHSYTVLYTFKIYRSAVILEVDRPFGGRSGAIAVSLALLLLGGRGGRHSACCSSTAGECARWVVPSAGVKRRGASACRWPPLPAFSRGLVLSGSPISLFYGKLRPRTDTGLGTFGSWGSGLLGEGVASQHWGD